MVEDGYAEVKRDEEAALVQGEAKVGGDVEMALGRAGSADEPTTPSAPPAA